MSASNFSLATSTDLQGGFLALVPKIETHARIFFRHVKRAFKKADFIAEAVALAWRWLVRLAQRGKDAAKFVTTLASLAARAIWNGCRLCGQEKAKDVMSPLAQRNHGFVVESLPAHTRTTPQKLCSMPGGQEMQSALEERLHDNTITPVPDQAAFRIDFW